MIDPNTGSCYTASMRVLAKKTLKNFWESKPEYMDSQGPLETWYLETLKANWETPQEIKAKYKSASILKNGRVVFNIAGNKYRLIISINYKAKMCFVKFVGTHKEYDKINAETVA